MKKSEDTVKGLMAISLDDSNENVLQFGRMKYDGSLRVFRSDSVLNLDDFVSYQTKAQAVKAAKNLSIPASHVERIGSRFWSCWGIRHDFRDHYFLAAYE